MARVLLVLCLCGLAASGGEKWGAYWEAEQPVLGSTVDARAWASGNLVVRGEVVRFGDGLYGCYDVDMVRLAAVWRGDGLSADGMSSNSYPWEKRGQKVPGGQKRLPKPLGQPVSVLPLVPGVGVGSLPTGDPRAAGPEPQDVGRGPVAAKFGKWLGRYETAAGPVVAYEVAGVRVVERLAAWGDDGYVRHLTVGERRETLKVRLAGAGPNSTRGKGNFKVSPGAGCSIQMDGASICLEIPAGAEKTVAVGIGGTDAPPAAVAVSLVPGARRWPGEEVTSLAESQTINGAYRLDGVALPTPNRWRRNVRLAGIDFFEDGTAAVSTFDGDVWLVRGLGGELDKVRWQRYAAGLFEPLNLLVADGKIMVWTRNGLVRLHDRNDDGEADFYETFCHLPPQSAETREFAMSLVRHPDGSYYVSKGAQSQTHQSMLPGTVVRIAGDGGSYEVIATGLREPFLGIHPRSGAVVASDQQGHWVPSTPVHLVEKGDWFGFFSKRQKPTEQKPKQPLQWQPHRLQASGVGMVWADAERFGPLSGKLLGFDYFSGKTLVMDWRDEGPRVTGAWQLDGAFSSGPLHAAVNPADGQVYVVGFGLWGAARKGLSSLTRIRYAGGTAMAPIRVEAFAEGVMIRMGMVVDAVTALRPANYMVERWNYQRSGKYGSGHFDPTTGKSGQELVPKQSVTLSDDGKGIFLRLAAMPAVDQLSVRAKLVDLAGKTKEFTVWTTVRDLEKFRPAGHGFPPLRPAQAAVAEEKATVAVSAALGKQVAAQFGCVACHSDDGTTEGRTGPSWKSVYMSERVGKDGKRRQADDAYLRESIMEPTAFVLKGFDKDGVGMPAYAGVLKPHEIDSLIEYVKTLK